jgi:4-amino-4-deoxy-L-arabinose transferase-like glycosyltransferase
VVSQPVGGARPRSVWALCLLAAVVLAGAAIRLRLLDVPLDRDEGEYAYFGQLLLEGVPPYAAAYNLKAPGIYGAYALILAAFGQTTTGIRLGLILVTSATTVLTYVLARRLVGPAAALVAAAVHATHALNPKVLGLAAYAEHFVLLPVVAGSLVLQAQARDRRPLLLFAGGLLFGLAFLMKQSAAAFVVGGALSLLLSSAPDETPRWPRRIRATALFVAGAVTPFALACLALLRAGTLGTFWFWAFVYGSTYSAGLPEGWTKLVARFVAVAPSTSVTLSLGAIGLGALLWGRLRSRRAPVLLLVAASCLGTMVGLHFRPQYCLLMLLALALLAAIGFDALGGLLVGPRASFLRRAVPVVLAAAALGQPLYASRDVLFELGPAQVSRAVYGRNPFPESVEVARYIREHTMPSDRVAVVGSEPQIYFYAGRRSATGYIYTYPLMELQPYAAAMQQQMIREIENADPRYLVFVRATGSWLVRENSDRTIFGWFEQYQRSFNRVGVADIMSRQETVYRWDGDAREYAPRSDVWLMVFERGRKP